MTQNIGSLAVSLSMDSSNFNASITQVDRNLRAMGSELKASKALGADYGKSLDGLKSKKDILSRSTETAALKLKMERERYDELVASGKQNEAQLEAQANRVNKAQAQYNQLSTELATVEKQLKTQSSAWNTVGTSMENAGNKFKAAGKGMEDAGRNLTMKVSAPIAALGAGAFKAAVDFESAFAGVRKTVDATEAEFATLERGIRDMAKELPTAATDIAAVAESAGQLGIKNEAILGFTRTIIDLGEATNLTREQAATEFARFANIVQMPQENFDKLGSSVVALGNNLATTESEILSMGMRISGTAAQIKLTEPQIMALAGAMSSVGIEAEAGGTAMSMVMKKMQNAVSNAAEGSKNDLNSFAATAGMTADEFAKAFESRPIEAIDAFIKGLARSSKEGKNLNSILDDVGIKGIRESDTMLRLAGASELLGDSVNIATKAWEENNALSNEAAQRYETTASKMKILWNQTMDVGIAFGEHLIPLAEEAMDKIGGLVDKFGSLDKEQQRNILKMAGLAAAAGPVLSVTGKLSSSFGNLLLIGGSLSKGIAGGGGLVASLGAIAGPGAIAVGALAAVGAAGYGLYKVLNKTSIPEIDIFGDKVSENTKKAVGSFVEMSDEAQVQLNQLKWSGVAVSEEMAEEMIGTFSGMSKTILEEMKTDHASQIETVSNHLATLKSMSVEEQKEILDSVVEGHKEREKRVEDLERQYNQIIQNASNERRKTTDEENNALEKIRREASETAIEYLSETEREQKVILERLKNESGKITAEQAIETSARAKETKEAVIEEAEKMFDEQIKTYLMLRDEAKTISADKYEALVTDAENTRDETIAAANGQYEELIRIALEKGGEYVTEEELRSGRLMTIWEKHTRKIGEETTKMSVKTVSTLRQMATDAGIEFTNLRNDAIKSASELVKGYRLSVDKLPGVVKDMMTDAAIEATKGIANFFKAGEDIGQGLINGLKSKAKEVAVETGKLGINMLQRFKDELGIRSPVEKSSGTTKKRADKLEVLLLLMEDDKRPTIKLNEVAFA